MFARPGIAESVLCKGELGILDLTLNISLLESSVDRLAIHKVKLETDRLDEALNPHR